MLVYRLKQQKQGNKMKTPKFEERLKNITINRFLDSIVEHTDTLEAVAIWYEDHKNILDSASMVELTKSIVSRANCTG